MDYAQKAAMNILGPYNGTPVSIHGIDLDDATEFIQEAIGLAVSRVISERDEAVRLLAEWCVMVDRNGAGWDDWDEGYKAAMYRDTPIRSLLDAAIRKASEDRDGH